MFSFFGVTDGVMSPVKKQKYTYTKVNKNTHGILILLGVETKPRGPMQLCIV